MKIWTSELCHNPALRSYGYSVYATPEYSEDFATLYESGFLPCVLALDQPQNMFIASRSLRVPIASFQESAYADFKRSRVLVEKRFGTLTSSIQTIADLTEDQRHSLTSLLVDFITKGFGAREMSHQRAEKILSRCTHVRTFTFEKGARGYTLEVHSKNSIHVWNHMYECEHTKTNLGFVLYLHLLGILNAQSHAASVQYLYFGNAYGTAALYKTRFSPLELWNGAARVHETGASLRTLLRGDVLRGVPLLDAWRCTRKPYKDAPYGLLSVRDELHWLILLNQGFPRLAVPCALFVGTLLFAQVFLSLM
jgi:hypothetical protein